jgi:protein arginine N-methyltransferase 1
LAITGYSVAAYTGMITDDRRAGPYVEALRRAVRPGSVVLDIGTGTGAFAMLAARFGARRVFAVEPGDVIHMAREILRDNDGLAERVELIQDLSTRITLPEPADVIVSDLRGVLPFLQQHIPSIIDARARHLAPGGVLIPRRDRLWLAPVEAPGLYAHHALSPELSAYGLRLAAARRVTANAWCRAEVVPEQLLAEPLPWVTLDYATVGSPDAVGTASFTAARPSTCHGLAVWFDAELADGIGFSNAPAERPLLYGCAFFPWWAPVPLAAGDVAQVELGATLIGEDYVWRWKAEVHAQGDPERRLARFDQSTFQAVLQGPAQLRKRDASYVPHLAMDGELERLALDLMDGQRSLREIAEALSERFPERFGDWAAAMNLVGPLSQRFSR